MKRQRQRILTATQATATFTFLGVALAVVPFLANGGWTRGIAIIGIVLLSLCVLVINRDAAREAFGPNGQLRLLLIPVLSLAFLIALTAAVSADIPGRILAVRPSESEVVEPFDVEGMEKTTARTLLRSYNC